MTLAVLRDDGKRRTDVQPLAVVGEGADQQHDLRARLRRPVERGAEGRNAFVEDVRRGGGLR
ncbi:MAG: hypothetical protein BGO06_20810 [Shinella sp. 65-6]|nr:MAG: hypothetical protein BGO06_20810 [Shinella sp. 65-6]